MEAIRFENISKMYKEGNMTFTALDNINMSVNSGEFVAVIGPSGSGKSTFLSIAGALLKPTEGNVYINGVNLAQLKQKALSKIRLTEIGFILQTSNLIPYLTVLDQLLVVKRMLGRIKKEDKQFAVQLLEEVGLGISWINIRRNYPAAKDSGQPSPGRS